MRILICDDDCMIAEQIEHFVQSYFKSVCIKCPEIAVFADGASLLADQGKRDILFLDIEMPGMDGIYVGNELKKRDSKTIIFVVTSYSEYLDDAMRFHVFRYLSKPLDKQRIYRNMKDAIDLYNTASAKVAVETKQGVHTIPVTSIVMVEAVGRKVTIYTTHGNYESVRNLQHWLEQSDRRYGKITHMRRLLNRLF